MRRLIGLTPSLVRACRRIFAVFDANGDGLLDFDELMRVSALKPSTPGLLWSTLEYSGVPPGWRRPPRLRGAHACEYPPSTPVSTPVITPVSALVYP